MTEVMKHESNPIEGVQLTEAAKKHFLLGLSKEPGLIGVCLSLKKTGCSGLSYVLDYVREIPDKALVFPLEGSYSFFVDKAWYPTLKGIKIDFVKEGLNQKLIFTNPSQTGQCGCGESFTVN